MRRAVWMGWALGALLGACAESRSVDDSVFAACFEGRQLEENARKLDEECVSEIDANADGVIDERTVKTFDDEGRLIEVRVDGRVTRSIEYEADGVVVRTWYAPDGTIWERSTEEHDEAGNVLVVSTDQDGDGSFDWVEHHGYGCWEEERAQLWSGPCTVELDQDGDGDVDVTTTASYDSSDRPEMAIRETARGRSVSYYAYGAHAEFEQISIDQDDDGEIDRATGVAFDEQRRIVRVWSDADADEEPEVTTDYEYDDEDRVVLEVWTQDGVVRRRETRYLEGGRRSIEIVSDSRGPEHGLTFEQRLDGAGNVIAMATDNGSDGSVDMCAYASYACWSER